MGVKWNMRRDIVPDIGNIGQDCLGEEVTNEVSSMW